MQKVIACNIRTYGESGFTGAPEHHYEMLMLHQDHGLQEIYREPPGRAHKEQQVLRLNLHNCISGHHDTGDSGGDL